MKSCLLVLPDPPLPFEGAAARWNYALIRELSSRGLDIDVYCVADRPHHVAATEAIHEQNVKFRFFGIQPRRGRSRLTNLLKPIGSHFTLEMEAAVNSCNPNAYDFVLFQTTCTARLIQKNISNSFLHVLNIDAIDRRGLKKVRPIERIRNLFHSAHEKRLLGKPAHLIALTPRIAKKLAEWHPKSRIGTVPLTIDFSLYDSPSIGVARGGESEQQFIGLIGSFTWPPTLSAARSMITEIWPKIRARRPHLKLIFVGRQADKVLESEFGKKLFEDERIQVLSDVDDIAPYFHKLSTLVYLPDVGTGMKIKVLEAIAFGTPVVTNYDGAEGLPPKIAKAIEADSRDSAIEMILSRVDNFQQAQLQAASIRSDLIQTHSVEHCVDTLLTCISRFLSKPCSLSVRSR